MSYYAGDFYAMGDPGFMSAIGRFFKRAAPSALALVPGAGPLAKLAGRVGPLARRGVGMVMKHPGVAAVGAIATAGGVTATVAHRGAPTAAGMAMPAPGISLMGQRMGGMHVSRRTGQLVRNRRMRVTNPRALRRAIRRANGFAKLARRVLHFTSPRPPRGRAIFRARRKKRV